MCIRYTHTSCEVCRLRRPISKERVHYDPCDEYRLYGGGGCGADNVPHCGVLTDFNATLKIARCQACLNRKHDTQANGPMEACLDRKYDTQANGPKTYPKSSSGFWGSVKKLFRGNEKQSKASCKATEPQSVRKARTENLAARNVQRAGATRQAVNPRTAPFAARTGPAVLERRETAPNPARPQWAEPKPKPTKQVALASFMALQDDEELLGESRLIAIDSPPPRT